MPRSGPGASTVTPPSTISPALNRTRPPMALRIVDLPQPEWPMIETISPRLTVRLMFLTAVKRPFGVSKLIVTSRACRYCELITGESGLARIRHLSGDEIESTIEQQPDQSDQQNRRHDALQAERVPTVPKEKSDAEAARQHLALDDHTAGYSQTQPQSRQNVRQRERDQDAAQIAPPRKSERARDIPVVIRQRPDAERGIDERGPQRGDEDHED